MKISCNVKQSTSLVKNSSQTVEIKDKTNEKKPYLEQNISNHKLDGSDKKANTNTSPEMKISCNVKQGTSLVNNSSQTVEIKDKTNEKKPYLEQNISNHKLDRSHKKANTNTLPEMKISCNVKQSTSLVKNSSQTVEIKDKTNEKKPYLEQNICNHKLDGSDQKVNTNTSPEMKISCNVKQGTSLVNNSSQTVEIKHKTNEKEPYLEQNISYHKLDGSNLDHSIKIFNNLLSKGPIYMCSAKQQLCIKPTGFLVTFLFKEYDCCFCIHFLICEWDNLYFPSFLTILYKRSGLPKLAGCEGSRYISFRYFSQLLIMISD